ncbi:hypothetical protein J6590_074936 [Homalodisca vitripennis]|nr:hypothetical protein J6590_074936 [Homalodisca vitripennis]
MDLTGQFVLVLLYQGAIVADLSELSHPQALANYDNGEATVDFAVSNGFGITEPPAVFHLSGWGLDPHQNIDLSLKASSPSDSGPQLKPGLTSSNQAIKESTLLSIGSTTRITLYGQNHKDTHGLEIAVDFIKCGQPLLKLL